jgi:outer membrane protein
LRKTSLKRFNENVEATRLKLEAGTVTPTVLAEAQSKYAKAKYELILAEGNLNNSTSKFKSITKLENVPNNLTLPKLNFKLPKTVDKAVNISLKTNPIILVAKLEKEIAKKNVDLNKSKNRPFIKMEFFGKDSQSSVNTSTSDYQSYGANLTFSTPLFYNESTKDSIRRLDKLSTATMIDLSEKNRQVELSTISSYQNYKSTLAKTSASKSEKMSSLLALNGIKKEAQFGIRTVLDVLDAEVEYLNASTNVIKSEAEEIYSQFDIKSILGNLSIRDINRKYKVNYDLKENDLNFKILDTKAFN